MAIRKKMTLFEMFDYVDADFWGRFFVINQTDEDRDWVLKEENLERNVVTKNINREKFIAMFDFYKTAIVSNVDRARINKIINKIQVPESIEDVYKKTCLRVAYLVFDGIVKWNRFCDKKELKCEERDYMDFESIWKEQVRRLFVGESDQPIDLIFSDAEKDLIVLIKEKEQITYDEFREICNARDINFITLFEIILFLQSP
jgi:hypothetical protein